MLRSSVDEATGRFPFGAISSASIGWSPSISETPSALPSDVAAAPGM